MGRARDELADSWTRQSGMLRSLAASIGGVGDLMRYYASLADSFPWEEVAISQAGQPALLVREPVGVVGAIMPWNGSSGMVCKVATASITGCTIIVKTSPEAPTAPYILGEICEKIGLPAGVVNIVTADREVSERLVRHPGVDKIAVTGLTVAGRRIASLCGERIARCTLELGGKSPATILDDYDIETAAGSIIRYAGFLTGQVCSSLTRLIISRKRHDDFVAALASAFTMPSHVGHDGPMPSIR